MGYMGSGKSTIGKQLAQSLKYPFVDLDEYIEVQEQLSIKELFSQKGELYFRKKESFFLQKLLKEHQNLVLSLGGGTPCFAGNLEALQQQGSVSVYLKSSIKVLTDRLFKEKDQRPLIAHVTEKGQLEDFIRKHLFERAFYYNQANIIANTDNKSISEIVSNLSEEVC